MLKADAIQRVIDIAVGEIGYLEKASADRLDSKTENAGSGNYTKYWRDIYPAYQAQPWCACFVSWVYKKAFGEETAKELLRHWPYVYCPTLANLFTRHANPTVGDIVIFCRNGIFTHTGIVTNVSGDYFETVEGNTSGSFGIVENGGGVWKKAYYNSQLPGTKFCSPDWSVVTTEIVRKKNADGTYTVQRGDTLLDIANDFSCTTAELQKWNRLPNNEIAEGHKLKFFYRKEICIKRSNFRQTPGIEGKKVKGKEKVEVGEVLELLGSKKILVHSRRKKWYRARKQNGVEGWCPALKFQKIRKT